VEAGRATYRGWPGLGFDGQPAEVAVLGRPGFAPPASAVLVGLERREDARTNTACLVHPARAES
jgi:hypothetical protein